MCGGCGGGSFEQHSFFVSSGGFKYGSNHDCTPSTGCPHDSCWILTERPRQPLDELVEGLKAGRVDVVENLLTGSRDYLAFNAERRAIQLYSPCAPDIVVAHLPLNVVQLAAAMRLSPQPAESD
jgi:hypothetical protein